ncbi:MAG: hypothetical protein JST68_17240 [Bacteroidetes bacterium]|nr:hypothetical protein [Bacteroidota bacterium]
MTNISTSGIGGYNFTSGTDVALPFDYGHTGKQDYIVCYRPGGRTIWMLNHSGALVTPSTFTPFFQSASGFAGYDLNSPRDRIIAFDYEHSRRTDYLLAYRPRDKAVYIIKNNTVFPNTNQGFTAVIQSHNGIGGFDVSTDYDRIAAFDYEHSGRLDYLVATRMGSKIVWILKNNNNGTFSPVFQSSNGIATDLFNINELGYDGVFAFDYDHSGKRDYLVCYSVQHGYVNFGQYVSTSYLGYIYVIGHDASGTFSTKIYLNYGLSFQGTGYSLFGQHVYVTPFDYEHSGKMDYLIVYRPGALGFNYIDILKNNNDGTVTTVYTGIGGWDLTQDADQIVAYDYEHSGKQDYLLITRAGSGFVTILKNRNGAFTQVF